MGKIDPHRQGLAEQYIREAMQIGYFAQNQASLLDENLTVFQTIDDVAKG